MANFEFMIPHILHREVGLKKQEKELSPRMMYESVSKRGFHIISGDKGGPTMCGVTLNTFRMWRKNKGKPAPSISDLKRLTFDEWVAILRHLFWDPCRADEISNDSIAMMLVDWRWVNGLQAIRDAQNVLSLRQDGIVGPKTLAALNGPEPESIFTRLKAARLASYRKIVERNESQKIFFNGWVNRTNSIQFRP